jgi:hypothetical protein
MRWFSRLSPRSQDIIAVGLIVMFGAAGAVGAALSPHGSNRQCVDTKNMKVAASARCQTGGTGATTGATSGTGTGTGGTKTADTYKWYYGVAGTQVGRPARNGSFSEPDDQGQSYQSGSGSDDEGDDYSDIGTGAGPGAGTGGADDGGFGGASSGDDG